MTRAERWNATLRAFVAPTSPVQRAELTLGGRPLVIVRYCSGPLELYRHYPDGMEKFVGYARDVFVPR